MPNQQISNENRERIIALYLNEHSASEISKMLGFERTSVYAVIKKYKQNLKTKRQFKGGRY
ncbi:hypothetical protein H311_00676 [Anncaliia algerae PRA109]|nr:hypothetical protein H311_00676 [Anncaliia algerae PRA109]